MGLRDAAKQVGKMIGLTGEKPRTGETKGEAQRRHDEENAATTAAAGATAAGSVGGGS